jgi:transposase
MPSYDIATRAQALTLKAMGRPNAEIQLITGMQPRTVQLLYQKALERGFDPETKIILNHHVDDGKRSGRPKKQTTELIQDVVSKVRRDRYGREKSCSQIAADLGGRASAMTVWRILRAAGFGKTKPTRKPGLTPEMKQARLQFALDHEHWTLEDWKKVIWSDETSVVCGFRRGGYRVWRCSNEKMKRSCIRPEFSEHTRGVGGCTRRI